MCTFPVNSFCAWWLICFYGFLPRLIYKQNIILEIIKERKYMNTKIYLSLENKGGTYYCCQQIYKQIFFRKVCLPKRYMDNTSLVCSIFNFAFLEFCYSLREIMVKTHQRNLGIVKWTIELEVVTVPALGWKTQFQEEKIEGDSAWRERRK